MAGAGSRFSKKGYKDPKPLINVSNKPMIIQAVKCLPNTTNQVFICQEKHLQDYPLEENIRNYYYNSKIIPLNNITEGQACTTEIGIINSNIKNDDAILISACDNGIYFNHEKYNSLVNNNEIDIIVWTFKNEPTSRNNPNMYAWLETDENEFIKNVSCKKFDSQKHDLVNSHVIIGTMFYRKSKHFLDGLKKNYEENIRSNNEFYVDDVLNQNIKMGLKVKAFQVENYICWGTPDDYETYNYWQNFFHRCPWHPYNKRLDITIIN
jgi:NDP-sugar pyrophosphorylase family protein